MSLTKEVYQAMVDNADGAKKVWGTAFGTPQGDPAVNSKFDTAAQLQSVVSAALTIWFTDFKAFTGPLIWDRLRDPTSSSVDLSVNFGAMDPGYSKKTYHADLKTVLAGSLP